MLILREPLSLKEIQEKHSRFFSTMVKIVVDLERELLALDAEMHADLEQQLLEEGSNQAHLWGANVYFDGPNRIEFTSLINIRPAQGNRGMEVESPETKQKIEGVVKKLILF